MTKLQSTRRVRLRLHGEEIRRFHADVVVEVPDNVTDEQLERMWARQFDGLRQLVDWVFDCTTGIWPSNCGRRIQPQVLGGAGAKEPALVRFDKSPKGSLVVRLGRSL